MHPSGKVRLVGLDEAVNEVATRSVARRRYNHLRSRRPPSYPRRRSMSWTSPLGWILIRRLRRVINTITTIITITIIRWHHSRIRVWRITLICRHPVIKTGHLGPMIPAIEPPRCSSTESQRTLAMKKKQQLVYRRESSLSGGIARILRTQQSSFETCCRASLRVRVSPNLTP